MEQPRVILIGGFVGAGKTTLIGQAARRLVAAGKRVGIVSNDQAAHLVDTALLQSQTMEVREVAGGCFCCRFGELTARLEELHQHAHADVLLAEPVGSCTDLSATVLQPLKRFYRDRYTLAPFSVLLDPHRLRQLLWPDGAALPAAVQYIYRVQIEEADAIVLNKADLLSASEFGELTAAVAAKFPQAALFTVSALRGDGIDAWLAHVMGNAKSGQHIAQVDYQKYAAGEAALGWLNASVRLTGPGHTDWPMVCQRLLDGLAARLRQRRAEIVHAKLLLTAPGGVLAGNLTGSDQPASVRGQLGGDTPTVTLVLNVRAHVDPQILRQCVGDSLDGAAQPTITVAVMEIESFSPAPPRPMYRFAEVEPERVIPPSRERV